jgi:predicted aspartyl protease
MPEQVSFDITHFYDTRQPGITVDASLRLGERTVDVIAKVDTGATYYIFRRLYGELLGLNIESGVPENISTAMGSFRAYGHELTLIVLGLELTGMFYFAEPETFTRNVLGQNGLLNRTKFGLIDYEGKMLLSDYNAPNE